MYSAPPDPVADDARDQVGRLPRQGVGRREHRQTCVGSQADHHDVRHGAEPRPLPQRDPQQQHDGTGRDDHLAEGEWEAQRDALVEDVPRVQAESGAHQQGHRESVDHEPDEQLSEAQHEPSHGWLRSSCCGHVVPAVSAA